MADDKLNERARKLKGVADDGTWIQCPVEQVVAFSAELVAEARVEEAKWWAKYHGKDYNGEGVARLADLEATLAKLRGRKVKQ